MILPFKTAHRVTAIVSAPKEKLTNEWAGWEDGSYVVGILDGVVVGATPLGAGMMLYDSTHVVEVMTMLSAYLPVEVRATVREELLRFCRGSLDNRVSTK